MANVMMNVYKGQRMDITGQMRDADQILEVFRDCNIRFDKKYTTITGKGPSTITFKGLRPENTHSDLTEMIMELHKMAKCDTIGNVYVKFTSFVRQQAASSGSTPEEKKETETAATEENAENKPVEAGEKTISFEEVMDVLKAHPENVTTTNIAAPETEAPSIETTPTFTGSDDTL